MSNLTGVDSYADKYFKKRVKKFITEIAGLCEARLLVFTIRDSGVGKKKWVSVYAIESCELEVDAYLLLELRTIRDPSSWQQSIPTI